MALSEAARHASPGVIDFGKKHRGDTFEQVAQADPMYVKWSLAHPSEGMKEFLEWLQWYLIPEMEMLSPDGCDHDYAQVREVMENNLASMQHVFQELSETKKAQVFFTILVARHFLFPHLHR